MTNDGSYGIGELAERAEITVRAVRYYISLGLLPPPNEKGPSASYSNEHLERLRLIEQLKERRLSLTEINTMIAKMSTAQIAEFLSGAQALVSEAFFADEGLARMSQTVTDSDDVLKLKSRTRNRVVLPHLTDESYGGGAPESEAWVRQQVTDGVEIHYRTPMDEETENKVTCPQ